MNYLAVDVGGTSTRAVILHDDGTCIAYGTAGSGNPTSSGAEQSVTSIVAATAAAMAQAGLTTSDVAAGVIAIAGAAGGTGARLSTRFAGAGLPTRLTLEPDLLAAYNSGSLASEGYALVAGTGAAAVRIRGGRIEATCDGLGWLLGDAGSGFWIGHRAVLAAISMLDGRGQSTLLAEWVLGELGLHRTSERDRDGRLVALNDAVGALYKLRPVELSRFAPLVFEAEAVGDDVARRIVAEAADALAATLGTVADPDIDGPVVLAGSILSQQPSVAQRVVRSIGNAVDDRRVVMVSDGLPGAAVLALRDDGLRVDHETFERIQTSLTSLR
jgi:glucosamine kinase